MELPCFLERCLIIQVAVLLFAHVSGKLKKKKFVIFCDMDLIVSCYVFECLRDFN